ncbi:hypothetical protein [Sphingomonas lenta]|uniref:Uncharacterized protein n=1 Tax=Sphingomonas lenta TaxID=1141887 RepID=A0A2A2SJR4_9SPHN|nr:hypothetical protein [Sphingomonas lenta]PAX09472.1 hypothetical protein CKY28_01605 [Sphingomonas lenta]
MTIARTTEERSSVDEIINEINALDQNALEDFGAWQALADLSSRTQFETVDGDPDSVVMDTEGRFEAIATVYVTLVYGSSDDEDSISDEYLATVRGRSGVGDVTIESIHVDTRSFYE